MAGAASGQQQASRENGSNQREHFGPRLVTESPYPKLLLSRMQSMHPIDQAGGSL